MGKIKNENYVVVQGWMVSELGLKGNSLLIYAIIYGFSQTEGQVFNGGLQYLADWTNSTKQGVMNCLKKLVELELIERNEKIINGVKFVEYYVKKLDGVLNKVAWGGKKSLMGIKQSLPNNINNNIINNKDNTTNIDKSILVEKTPKQFGNPEINQLFEEWEKICGFRIDSKIKMNRYACQRLIKSKGLDNVIKVLPYVAESQTDKYAPSINNFIDLSEKWNNLWVWLKKKTMTEAMKYSTIKV